MAKTPPQRVIIHAGFHKTGTSTLQATLRRNQARLGPEIAVFLKPEMKALCEAARGFSISRTPVDLGLVQYEAALLAQSLRAPVTLLCSEDLVGHMPGRHGLTDYGAAPDIMRAILSAILAVRKKAQVTYFFTTRAPDPWLRSCHAQNIRASRQTLDRGAFGRRFRSAADLDAIVAAVADTVAPIPVQTEPLERWQSDPLGTLRPLLDLIGGPPARVLPVTPQNAALPDAILAKLLRLNRSDLDDVALRAAKLALLDAAP